MKTPFNKIFLSGILASGLMFNLYGQKKEYKRPKMIEIIDKDHNKMPEEYNLWEKENDKSISLKKYFDGNQDGELDSIAVFIYNPEYNRVFVVKKETIIPMEITEMKIAKRNLLIGKNYLNCKEGYFKKNIYDYIKK
ncbi:MAG TPA: hypothetical protein VJA20_02450 [Candidatus Nanoarchaeia archaeon]|nr:hypothetical protein [Candidatus Nanoarchaeia archaeon]